MKSVCLVDDEANIRQLVELILKSMGCRVYAYGSPTKALDGIQDRRPDLIISDRHLSDSMCGIELIKRLREACGEPEIPAMLLTGSMGFDPEEEARVSLMEDVIMVKKPFNVMELRTQVEQMLADTSVC